MSRHPSATTGAASPPTLQPLHFVICSRCRALHRPEDERAFDAICEACRRSGVVQARAVPRFHRLDDAAIADAVGEISPGAYALGYFDGSGFTAFYVGRSDSDLGARLREWVGVPSCIRHHAPSPYTPWRSRSGPLAGLGTRTLGRIAVGVDTAYTHFTFCYAPSAIAAFEQECRDYHALGGSDVLDNTRHPEPPPGRPWICPVHGAFERPDAVAVRVTGI